MLRNACLAVSDVFPGDKDDPAIWYAHNRVQRILEDHVIGGQPCEDWVIRRTPFNAPASN